VSRRLHSSGPLIAPGTSYVFVWPFMIHGFHLAFLWLCSALYGLVVVGTSVGSWFSRLSFAALVFHWPFMVPVRVGTSVPFIGLSFRGSRFA
jgi:hypothetical protein